jgi:transposase InsO family protein
MATDVSRMKLRRRGIVVNHKRIARIMREEALTPRRVRRFLATTDSDHDDPVYENLAIGLRPGRPNQAVGRRYHLYSAALRDLSILRCCSMRGRVESSVTPSAIRSACN